MEAILNTFDSYPSLLWWVIGMAVIGLAGVGTFLYLLLSTNPYNEKDNTDIEWDC